MVQGAVGDSAELQADELFPAPGADDQQVGGGGALGQYLVGGALDRAPAQAHLGMFGRRGLKGLVEQFGSPFREVGRPCAPHQQVVGRFMGLPSPGADDVEFRVSDGRLTEGEPHGKRVQVVFTDAEQDAPVACFQGLPVPTDDDNRTVGSGGHDESDGSEQKVGELAAPACPDDEDRALPPLTEQRTGRVLGEDVRSEGRSGARRRARSAAVPTMFSARTWPEGRSVVQAGTTPS